jgi:hypothetical protein
MNGNFLRKGPSVAQKPVNTHSDNKYVKSIDLVGLLFTGVGIKHGTIQLTQKTISNEKVHVRIGYRRFRRL